jgi:transmembrane sensor
MKMEQGNETFLASWLEGKMSDSQLKQLVSEDDFIAFQTIKNRTENWTVVEPNMEQNYAAIQQKLANKKSETKVFPLWRYVAVAASFVLVFALYQLLVFSNEVVTDFGRTNVVTLADNSKVTLNSKAKITYPNWFQWNRNITLEGEAFFEVSKGSNFTVETSLGTITVLGTKFNVNSFNDYFEVICYEGKVNVVSQNKVTLLTQGEILRCYNNNRENWAEVQPEQPLWISGESAFKNIPMKYVIEKFKKQFNVEVEYPKNIELIKFTGSFSNTDKNIALKSICLPLNLNYSNSNSKTIQLSE